MTSRPEVHLACAVSEVAGGAVAPLVSVVLPCLDEVGSVGGCVTAARDALARAGIAGEVVVADNGSSDGSVEAAQAAGARVVPAPIPGYGSAVMAGVGGAKGEIVVMADADGSYDLAELQVLVRPIETGEADLALGSRLGSPGARSLPALHRFVGTPVLSFLLRRAAPGLDVRDSQSGYRAFRAARIRRLGLAAPGMEFASEMLVRAAQAGFRITEQPVSYRQRTGRSKLRTFADGWRHLQLIVLLAPQLLLFWPGLTLLGVGLAVSALSLAHPAGLGPLRWQPVFLAPIMIVLGSMAALAGAVVAHHSTLAGPGAHRRFTLVGDRRFPGWCMTAGAAALATGIGLDVALFAIWITEESSPRQALALAGIAQALLITGAALAGFGVLYRLLSGRDGLRGVGPLVAPPESGGAAGAGEAGPGLPEAPD